MAVHPMGRQNLADIHLERSNTSKVEERIRRFTAPNNRHRNSLYEISSETREQLRRTSLNKLATISENATIGRQQTAQQSRGKKINIPNYVWHLIMRHFDLRFILVKLMCLNVETREFFISLNSALFDQFIRTYGLIQKLRRTDLLSKLDLIPFLTSLEKNMVRAEKEKALSDAAYQSFMEKWKLKHVAASVAEKRNAFRRKQHSQQYLARPPEQDDLIFEFDQNQFVTGKQLQVFPFMTDGGFQTSSRNTNTMLELFNSKHKDEFSHLAQKRQNPFGVYSASSEQKNFRQYISARTKDVSVACYLGRECANKDYSNFQVSKKIGKKDVSLASMSSTMAHLQQQKGEKNGGASGQVQQIKLRVIPLESHYLMKKDEKETYKVLHQMEFNSFREQAQLSNKANAAL